MLCLASVGWGWLLVSGSVNGASGSYVATNVLELWGPQCWQLYVFCMFSMNPNCLLKDELLYELCIREISSDATAKPNFTTELLICALGYITMRTLAYKSCILECQRPNSLCQCGNFFYLHIFWLTLKVCLCLAIAVQPTLHSVYFILLLHSRNYTDYYFFCRLLKG
jgi:hypothetical protein